MLCRLTFNDGLGDLLENVLLTHEWAENAIKGETVRACHVAHLAFGSALNQVIERGGAYSDCDGEVFEGDALAVVAFLLQLVLRPNATDHLDALTLRHL